MTHTRMRGLAQVTTAWAFGLLALACAAPNAGADASTATDASSGGDGATSADGLAAPETGLGCGELRSTLAATDCRPATPTLDPRTCRCLLGYVWDGAACAPSARCRCYAGCEQVYETQAACETAYARCLGR